MRGRDEHECAASDERECFTFGADAPAFLGDRPATLAPPRDPVGSLGAVAALYKARVRGPLLQQLAHAKRAERARPVPVPRATAAKFAAGVACAQGGGANGQDSTHDGGPKRARAQEPPAKRMPNVWYAQYNTMKKVRAARALA